MLLDYIQTGGMLQFCRALSTYKTRKRFCVIEFIKSLNNPKLTDFVLAINIYGYVMLNERRAIFKGNCLISIITNKDRGVSFFGQKRTTYSEETAKIILLACY